MSADVTRPPRGGKDPPAIRHLRIVSPTPPKAPRKRGQRRPPVFTAEEEARLRAALRNARALFGSWSCLADAMRLRTTYVQHVAGGRRVMGCVAIRLAKALGVPVETLYRAPTDASTCPHCGARRAP